VPLGRRHIPHAGPRGAIFIAPSGTIVDAELVAPRFIHIATLTSPSRATACHRSGSVSSFSSGSRHLLKPSNVCRYRPYSADRHCDVRELRRRNFAHRQDRLPPALRLLDLRAGGRVRLRRRPDPDGINSIRSSRSGLPTDSSYEGGSPRGRARRVRAGTHRRISRARAEARLAYRAT
jgi:hypothetical protein